jgi:hypothetical protein
VHLDYFVDPEWTRVPAGRAVRFTVLFVHSMPPTMGRFGISIP